MRCASVINVCARVLAFHQVLIPHLRMVFTPNKLSSSVDKAQNIAAEHVLREMCASMMESQGQSIRQTIILKRLSSSRMHVLYNCVENGFFVIERTLAKRKRKPGVTFLI